MMAFVIAAPPVAAFAFFKRRQRRKRGLGPDESAALPVPRGFMEHAFVFTGAVFLLFAGISTFLAILDICFVLDDDQRGKALPWLTISVAIFIGGFYLADYREPRKLKVADPPQDPNLSNYPRP